MNPKNIYFFSNKHNHPPLSIVMHLMKLLVPLIWIFMNVISCKIFSVLYESWRGEVIKKVSFQVWMNCAHKLEKKLFFRKISIEIFYGWVTWSDYAVEYFFHIHSSLKEKSLNQQIFPLIGFPFFHLLCSLFPLVL